MKFLFLILSISFVTVAFARKDVDFSKFSDAMNDNIDTVIKHNPQMYENKPIVNRMPASVNIEDENSKEMHEETEHKMDTIDYQNLGHPDI